MAFSQLGHSRTLKEELTCPLCLDIYRSPHMLPCGHNFCKKCLEHLRRQAERGRFRCPECRECHRCGTKLQKNFKLANISDDFRQQCRASASLASLSKAREPAAAAAAAAASLALQHCGSKLSVPCDYCPTLTAEAPGPSASRDGSTGASTCVENGAHEESPAAAAAAAAVQTYAVKTCLKCEVSMCPEHLRPHLELPAFREHLLTEPMSNLWKRKCPAHDEMYRYYCMDDKVCVCNACTIEGGHSGHRIKTLKNTMKDLKGKLDKHLCRAERKYSLAEKKLQEQKKKERQNKKCMDDCEQSLAVLTDEIGAKVNQFISRLQGCSQTHWNISGSVIKKNISRISQDQARLQEVCRGIESLMQENDPFSFIEAYKTTGKQCRRKLRKNMFYPEYVDMEMEYLGEILEMEMNKFLQEELPCRMTSAFSGMCHLSDAEGEEQVENDDDAVEEEEEEEDDDDDSDDLDDTSAEEMRSDQEDEDEEEEEEEEEEGGDEGTAGDDLFSPDEEAEEEEEEEEEGEDGEEEEEEEEEDEEDGRT